MTEYKKTLPAKVSEDKAPENPRNGEIEMNIAPLEDDELENVSGGNGSGGIGGGAGNENGVVTVHGGTVTSGGIIGYATGGIITNCSNSGSAAQPDAGGILGG